MSKRMRDVLVREGRVYVKWRACKVKEFVNVLQCHKCFAFGHTMRECSVESRLCERCGETGHLEEKCKNECVCRNCKLEGKKCDHLVLSTEFPDYVRILEREKARVSDEKALNIVQLNCQRSCAIMNDLSAVIVKERVNVTL